MARRSSRDAGTRGVFTTRKLQALIDSRRVPELGSRRALADALCARGERITQHGIDAWFKTRDSNYGLERTSLDPREPSFEIPRRRWPPLFEIFGLTLDDLAPDDTEFRRWCYANGSRALPLAKAEETMALCCCCAESDLERVEADGSWLAMSGHRIVAVEAASTDTECWLGQGMPDCDALLCYFSPDSVDAPCCRHALDEARRRGLPVVALRLQGDLELPAATPFHAVLDRPAEPAAEFYQRLSRALDSAPPAARTAEASGPAANWAAPEPITDRPSIAVMPFINLSGPGEHERLVDGIGWDLTTLLARIPEFFVIGGATPQAYQNAIPDSRVVSRQLGVRYVVQGTVRADGHKLRITVQLIDGATGRGVWSRRFDRVMDDVFRLQDEIALEVCAQLEPQLRLEDIAYGQRTGNMKSWRLWQEGWQLLFVDAPEPLPARSLERFRQALELDPDYPLAHAGVAIALGTGMVWGGLGPEHYQGAKAHAEQAYKLVPENPVVLYAMAMIAFMEPVSLEVPLDYLDRCVELEPSNPMYQGIRGYLLANLGRTEEGVEACQLAMRLSPKDAREPFLCHMLGHAYTANGDYRHAIETMTQCRRFSVVDFIWIVTAFAHHQLGETEQAMECLEAIERPRSLRFYAFSILERLWLTQPEEDKRAFLAAFPQSGIR